MTVEELKKHCEKQINLCSRLNDYKHLEEHQLILNLIEENKQLKDNWNKLKEIIKKKQDYYRHFKDNRYRKFLSELLDKMQELEGSDSNENNNI